MPRRFLPLGINGFGRSDTREALRSHFEIDAPALVVTALAAPAQEGARAGKTVAAAIKAYGIDTDQLDPMNA